MSSSELMVSIVLVEDTVGSTRLHASIGEDEANRLFRAHEDIVSEVVRTFDGDVVKGTGDGVLAIFRSESSAAEAAVTMSSTVGRALGDRGVAVRVGLAVGGIVVLDGDVQGMPVVRASRLCDAAVGHSILSEAAVVMLAGSRIDSLTGVSLDLDLKGIDDPVAAVELIGSTEPEPSALPALLQAEGPVVGREDEQGDFLARWNEVRSGRAQMVVVSGEAGVGKTSLVADVAARIQNSQGRGPTMLVIDDVHWMSEPAADMLVPALAGCATLPLLVVVTKRADTSARDDFESVVAALRRRRVPVSRVDLVGLRSDAIAQLMLTEGSLAGRPDRSAIAAAVARETGGNPLLVSAAVAHLATSDELDRLARPAQGGAGRGRTSPSLRAARSNTSGSGRCCSPSTTRISSCALVDRRRKWAHRRTG